MLQAQDLSVLSAYLLVCGARLETLTVYPRQVPGSNVLDDYGTKLIFHQFPVKPSIIYTMQEIRFVVPSVPDRKWRWLSGFKWAGQERKPGGAASA